MTNRDEPLLRAIAANQPPFANLIGLRVTAAAPDRVEAELDVTESLGNRAGVMHGGAIMAMADNIGGLATTLNLTRDFTTTTLESKTNFLRPVPAGEKACAVCVPLHRGRTTMVWQTTVTRADGKVAAIVTQTQMVLPRRTPETGT
ncbi:MAG: hypothetical protein BGN87_09790 [Rhizobiales bacterium 65-79]|jgi:uncharacterized protein (TIGR00369 family)|nr:PaaI family thioesterase [Hyphomicrobiales bacterium]OJU03669.1 MAG: hypothetical protein BGN87_09790 [Rhizobiales bacterium 65-79]